MRQINKSRHGALVIIAAETTAESEGFGAKPNEKSVCFHHVIIHPMRQSPVPTQPIPVPIKPTLIKPTPNPRIFGLEFRETPIREAFTSLFTFAKVKHTLGASVTGTVHMKVTQTTFDESLQLLCRHNTPRLLARKSGDTFVIEPRPDTATVEVMPLKQPVSTLSATQTIVPAKTFKGQKLEERRVTMSVQNAPIREVLTAYFDAFELDFVITPEVQGTASMTCENQFFETALRQLMRSSTIAITYTREGKRFFVRTRVPVG
jgi:type II secretory pathway component HofQ